MPTPRADRQARPERRMYLLIPTAKPSKRTETSLGITEQIQKHPSGTLSLVLSFKETRTNTTTRWFPGRSRSRGPAAPPERTRVSGSHGSPKEHLERIQALPRPATARRFCPFNLAEEQAASAR